MTLAAALISAEAHSSDAKVAAFRRLVGTAGAAPPPPGAWQRWLGVLACIRRLQGDRWPSILQACRYRLPPLVTLELRHRTCSTWQQ